MKKTKTRFLFPFIAGILMIAAGVIFLLDNIGMINIDYQILIGPLFVLGGIIFLLVFILNPGEWWALIPGFVLIAIGSTVFMGQYMENFNERWGGAIFLGFIALSFLVIYIAHPDNWWAIIPGGVLSTLAVTTLLQDDGVGGGVFFIGLALTFGLVYILPKPSGKLTWALYPAGILFLIGILVLLGATNLTDFILPMVLLGVGIFVIYRAMRKS